MDVPAGVTQEEGHTGFLVHLLSAVHALIFLARRIQPFLCLVDREVEFCVLTILEGYEVPPSYRGGDRLMMISFTPVSVVVAEGVSPRLSKFQSLVDEL